MKADYTFEWYVQEIPPRCRKPRDVLHTKTVEVNIPEFRGVEVDKNAPKPRDTVTHYTLNMLAKRTTRTTTRLKFAFRMR